MQEQWAAEQQEEWQCVETSRVAQDAIFRTLDTFVDLVVQFEAKDGVLKRTFSSRSHRAQLGHDPTGCNGNIESLTHLHTQEFIHHLPKIIAAIESGEVRDGVGDEVPLLHADGHIVWFEWRLALEPERHRFVVIFHDITDRHDWQQQRLEAIAREKEVLR
eukprot:CAMPEP_0119316584 /NCGR_PEP_ID=MMETSP1333-20130426/40119_1 /TAXON_ID=418940 /ORGANISM="Scyphosphaera apsteinii, Strain RCC1455" /LENGTH=160 /DNA_ID=CAMNT_0007322265 /DNA_START=18 /DNA_END=496 /DNA_ORIENTATION=+